MPIADVPKAFADRQGFAATGRPLVDSMPVSIRRHISLGMAEAHRVGGGP